MFQCVILATEEMLQTRLIENMKKNKKLMKQNLIHK